MKRYFTRAVEALAIALTFFWAVEGLAGESSRLRGTKASREPSSRSLISTPQLVSPFSKVPDWHKNPNAFAPAGRVQSWGILTPNRGSSYDSSGSSASNVWLQRSGQPRGNYLLQ